MDRRVGHLRRRDSQAWAACVLAGLVVFVAMLIVSAAHGGTGRAHPSTAPAVPTAPSVPAASVTVPDFIVGVWYQPTSSFPKWKARGVNTLFGFESENGAVTLDQYKQAAAIQGFVVILQSSICRPQDYADPMVIAIAADPDEPDGVGNTTAADMATRYSAIKLLTSKPVFINFDGWKMQYRPPADYVAYATAGDWLGMDFYPINRGTPAAVTQIGDRLDDLALYGKGKRRLAIIETSDQNLRVQAWANDTTWGAAPALTMRGPTPDEVLGEAKLAVAHGATGLVYFPDQIGNGWEGFDSTTDAVAAVLPQIAQAYAPTAAPATKPTTQVSDPLSGKTITIDGRSYKLTSN